MKKTIILAGSGHAHLEVLKILTRKEISEHRFVLVSPSLQSFYSGLIPRLIAGQIEASDLIIQAADFAKQKGFEFIQDSVASVDPKARSVSLSSGLKEYFDFLSVNVGGSVKRISSATSKNSIYLRPFDDFLPAWQDFLKSLNRNTGLNSDSCPKLLVIGGGSAAVEVATALHLRLIKMNCLQHEIHIVTKGSRLCEPYSETISAKILRSLLKLGIQVHFNRNVEQLASDHISSPPDLKIRFNHVFVVTPTQSSPLIDTSTDETLRSHSNIFVLGDAATSQFFPALPRSGVIAVRQGQHLAESLRQVLRGQSPSPMRFPARQLNILISGESKARLVWGDLSVEGAWPLQLKNWIDRRYINSFRLDPSSVL